MGSVREMVDSTGTVRARYDYDAWGIRTKVSGDLDAEFGYTGHFTDETSGLVLAMFRAYDPNTARWLSADPLGEGVNTYGNLYAYVNNDPIHKTDPLGLADGALGYLEAAGWGLFEGLAMWGDYVIPFADPAADAGVYDKESSSYKCSQPLRHVAAVTGTAAVGGAGVQKLATTRPDLFIAGVSLADETGVVGSGVAAALATTAARGPNSLRPAVTAALSTSGGKTFPGMSTSGYSATVPKLPLHPRLVGVLENMPEFLKRDFNHGGCAEIDALNRALHAGANTTGAFMDIASVARKGEKIPPCQACQFVLRVFGIKW